MELQRLEKYKKQFKYFDNQIESLQNYLLRLTPGEKILEPNIVSRDLHISSIDMLFLFSLAEKENLIRKKFLVYTKNHSFLGEYNDTNSIPKEMVELDTGKNIEEDDFYIDIAFEVANG